MEKHESCGADFLWLSFSLAVDTGCTSVQNASAAEMSSGQAAKEMAVTNAEHTLLCTEAVARMSHTALYLCLRGRGRQGVDWGDVSGSNVHALQA